MTNTAHEAGIPVSETDIQEYVNMFAAQHDNPVLHYHNLQHTGMVVKAAKQIADHYQLSTLDYFIVTTAAWFHDIGYYAGARNGHEEAGAKLASSFLQSKQVDPSVITKVAKCILATQMPQRATDLLEQIVCDADMFHLGTDDFSERNKLLRKEMEAVNGAAIAKPEWRCSSIGFMQEQHYYTDYCQLLLNDKKQQNLDRLIRRDEENKDGITAANISLEQSIPEVMKKEKAKDPGRGIETMFRITSANNQRLSDMADNKAHILITVNSIILSAIISLLLRKLDEYTQFTYPTFALLAMSVLTIVICILATRPSIPKGEFTKQDLADRNVNLLFFGNFYNMTLTDYTAGMQNVMADKDFLYETLIRDVYSQGVVLGRKYKLLRLAYNIFMFGLVVSIMGFIAAVVIYK